MAATAFDETVTFLYRHPWATTDEDNAVELLRDLQIEHEALIDERDTLQGELDELDDHATRITHASAQIDDLMTFVRRLHDTQKISDLEYERAKAIATREVPAAIMTPAGESAL